MDYSIIGKHSMIIERRFVTYSGFDSEMEIDEMDKEIDYAMEDANVKGRPEEALVVFDKYNRKGVAFGYGLNRVIAQKVSHSWPVDE